MDKNTKLENHLEEEFKKAVKNITTSNKTFDNETLLKLYGYYKQSTVGDCDKVCPSFFQLKEKAKWEAWNNHKGMKKKNAMKQYIKLVEELLK